MPPKSKLDGEFDFLDLYVYHCGMWKTPRVWYLWSGLSLLAACCGNNFWMQIFGPEKPLYPNLYVFLVGSSGLGKGYAIEFAEKLIPDNDIIINKDAPLNVTKQGLTDVMVKRSKLPQSKLLHGSRVWLITPELGDSLPAGPMSMQFVKHMTPMFDGVTGDKSDLTRTSGALLIKSPIVNWIAGSTPDWLFESVDSTATTGGFFARSFVVWGEREKFAEMNPSYPFDREPIRAYLREYVSILSRIRGEMVMSAKAQAYMTEEWFANNIRPEDPDKEAMWDREVQLVYKLCMLVCISSQDFCKLTKYKNKGKDNEEITVEVDRVIREHHVRRAVQWLNSVRSNVDKVLDYANKTRETIPLDATLRVIKKYGRIQRTQLIKNKILTRLGIRSNQLNEYIRTLEDRGEIEVSRSESGATFYSEKKRRAF